MAARIEGAQRRLANEQDGRAWLAWHIAALSRQKELPEFSEMIARQEKRPVQSQQEIEITIDQLFLAWGGDPAELAEVRKVRGDAP